MLEILRALTQVLHVWWIKDRIRVACSEGRLFRVCIGDRLLIDDRIFHVVARHDTQTGDVASVFFELAEEQSETSDLWSLGFAMQTEVASLCHLGRKLEISCERIAVLRANSFDMDV